jgi:hypothetical protein
VYRGESQGYGGAARGSEGHLDSGKARRECAAVLSRMRKRVVVVGGAGVAEIEDVDELLARRTPIKFWRNGG